MGGLKTQLNTPPSQKKISNPIKNILYIMNMKNALDKKISNPIRKYFLIIHFIIQFTDNFY